MMNQNNKPKTLFDKIWNNHLVDEQDDGTSLIYIDRHLVHEVTSPQAFEGLRNSNRTVRRPESTFAVADHNVPDVLLSGHHGKIKDWRKEHSFKRTKKNRPDLVKKKRGLD